MSPDPSSPLVPISAEEVEFAAKPILETFNHSELTGAEQIVMQMFI
jgi:hypothetical protein